MSLETNISQIVIIIWSGTVLSTAGYSLMLLTAALFPTWRRSPVNLVWLHMCGTKLLCQYALLWLYLDSLLLAPPTWLKTKIGHTVIYWCGNFLFHASCTWLAAGAWLAHRQLVTVPSDSVHPHFMKRAALCAYLTPLIMEATLTILPLVTNVSREIFNGIHDIYVVIIILFCVIMYARALCSVFDSRRAAGRPPPHLLNTTVLALMFALTSGVQYTIVVIQGYTNSLVLLKICLFILFYNVPVYAILLLIGIKQTRKLWSSLWNEKLWKCFTSRNKEIILQNAMDSTEFCSGPPDSLQRTQLAISARLIDSIVRQQTL